MDWADVAGEGIDDIDPAISLNNSDIAEELVSFLDCLELD